MHRRPRWPPYSDRSLVDAAEALKGPRIDQPDAVAVDAEAPRDFFLRQLVVVRQHSETADSARPEIPDDVADGRRQIGVERVGLDPHLLGLERGARLPLLPWAISRNLMLRAVWSTNDASEAGVRSRPRPGAPESSGETSCCAHRLPWGMRQRSSRHASCKHRLPELPRRAPPRRRDPRGPIASARLASLQTAAIGSPGQATSWHSADFPAASQRVRR